MAGPIAACKSSGRDPQRAIIAARTNDADTAYDQLERAGQIAGQLGEGRNDYNTEFGLANVGLYEIAVAVDLGDAGRALRVAATVDTAGLSAERRARMLIDVARAHAQRRQVTEAVAALREAEEITPEQVRSHELVRLLVSDLLTMPDSPGSDLRDLAGRLTARQQRGLFVDREGPLTWGQCTDATPGLLVSCVFVDRRRPLASGRWSRFGEAGRMRRQGAADG